MSGKARSPRGRRPAAESWESVAGWYDGWVGERGSHYHRAAAIPAAMGLLQPSRGESILDIGAGQGVLAPHVARSGASYTGVDLSPRLIELARRRHGSSGRFFVGDARALPEVPGVSGRRHDAAVFLLSIQDMDPLEPIMSSLDRVLGRPSRIVILMTHPAFRQPRHAGWGFDAGRKLTYRRIDAYLGELAVPMKSIGPARTVAFHRPISTYINVLASVGFAVDAMLEIPDLPDGQRPRGRRPADRADAEIPLFLGLRARRG